MKKLSLIALGLVAGLSVSAQPDVVKNAEKLVKAKDYGQAMEYIQQALNNPETKNTVTPWYLAGKVSYGIWDDVNLASQIPGNEVTPEQKGEAAKTILAGYNYLLKALPLDSVPDIKGKVKPKHSKEIRKIIGENYHSYRDGGIALINTRDYGAAYDLLDLYANLSTNPYADQKAFVADPDSVVAQVVYYQGLGAYLNQEYDKALKAVEKAREMGYSDKDMYLVGLDAATKLGNEELEQVYAREGNQKYGSNDVSFLASVINKGMNNKDYNSCYNAIDESFAIAAGDSIKSVLYNVKAIVNEREGKIAEGKANLQKSIELWPKNAKSYYDMGRFIQNEVAVMEDTADDATRMNTIVPALKEAVGYFEKSYELDDTQTDLPKLIYRIYYGLDQNYHLGNEYAEKAEYWKYM